MNRCLLYKQILPVSQNSLLIDLEDIQRYTTLTAAVLSHNHRVTKFVHGLASKPTSWSIDEHCNR